MDSKKFNEVVTNIVKYIMDDLKKCCYGSNFYFYIQDDTVIFKGFNIIHHIPGCTRYILQNYYSPPSNIIVRILPYKKQPNGIYVAKLKITEINEDD